MSAADPSDPFELHRFVAAQNGGATYERAVGELLQGRKTSHWMWFVFPQIAGLGRSPTARHFAIRSLAEARAYAAHPILGPRLVATTTIVGSHEGLSAEDIFGAVDAMKLRSSMTLFRRACPDRPEFAAVLERFFASQPDPETERLLGGDP
jgi:uncharacterized protein (DUF1810 family)